MKKLFLVLILMLNFISFSQKKDSVSKKSINIIQKECTLKKGIQLRLKRVFDDSRCPENVACIWAGEVSVEIVVYKNCKIIEGKTLTFNSKNFEENKKWFASYLSNQKIKDIEVVPNLKDSVLLNPKDYLIKVIY